MGLSSAGPAPISNQAFDFADRVAPETISAETINTVCKIKW